MTALTVNGTGPYTGWLTATTFTSDLDESVVPEPPASLKAKASDNSITIAWNPPSSKVNIGASNLDVFGSIFFKLIPDPVTQLRNILTCNITFA